MKKADLHGDEFQPEPVRPARQPKAEIPRLVDVCGLALDKITDFKQLDPRQPAVAIIDDVRKRLKKKKKSQSEIKSFYLGSMC